MKQGQTPVKSRSFKLIDSFGGLVRAGTEATTEVAVGTLRVMADTVTGVAQSVADNVNATVIQAIDVAQRGADRFITVLDDSRKVADNAVEKIKEETVASHDSSTTHHKKAG